MARQLVPDHVLLNGKTFKQAINKNLIVLNVIYTITITSFVYFAISTGLTVLTGCVSVFMLSVIKFFLDKFFVRTCFLDEAINALYQRTL